ncbi:MAG TPA: branched-chain amino acid ABC transporter permease, partial [Afipia sp.]
FGLFFIVVVMFAPGGITGLLMMHRPLIRGGTLGKVLPSYLVALVPTLIMLIGVMMAIESIVHYTMNPTDNPNIRPFGVPFDASSPMTWAVSAILAVGGFVVARMTWKRVAMAWDDALTTARTKGLAT